MNQIISVGKQRFSVNSEYLSEFSPLFASMFQIPTSADIVCEVDDECSAQFGNFLAALLPEPKRFYPNR